MSLSSPKVVSPKVVLVVRFNRCHACAAFVSAGGAADECR